MFKTFSDTEDPRDLSTCVWVKSTGPVFAGVWANAQDPAWHGSCNKLHVFGKEYFGYRMSFWRQVEITRTVYTNN